MQSANGARKQLITVGGLPLIVHTLHKLEQALCVDAVVVVAHPEEIQMIEQLVAEHSLTKVCNVVCGGETRMESVALGMKAIPPGYKLIAIHDGARPACPSALIDRVVEAAAKHGAAVPGLPPNDTVHKQKFKRLAGQLKREELVMAQTPQVFGLEAFDAALGYARTLSRTFTDDASVYALLQKPIHIVEGDARNIKVTTPFDIALAELFLMGGAKQGVRGCV